MFNRNTHQTPFADTKGAFHPVNRKPSPPVYAATKAQLAALSVISDRAGMARKTMSRHNFQKYIAEIRNALKHF